MAIDPWGPPRRYIQPPAIPGRPLSEEAMMGNPPPNMLQQPLPDYTPPMPSGPPPGDMQGLSRAIGDFVIAQAGQLGQSSGVAEMGDAFNQGLSDAGGIGGGISAPPVGVEPRTTTQSPADYQSAPQTPPTPPKPLIDTVVNGVRDLLYPDQPGPDIPIIQEMPPAGQLADWEGTRNVQPGINPNVHITGAPADVIPSTTVPTPVPSDLGALQRYGSQTGDEVAAAETETETVEGAAAAEVPSGYEEVYPNTRSEEVDWDLVKANWGGPFEDFEAWAAAFANEHRTAAYPYGFPPWVGSMIDPTENLLENIGALRWGQQFAASNGRAPNDFEYKQAWYENRFKLGRYNTQRYPGQAFHHPGAGWGKGFATRWGKEGWGEPWYHPSSGPHGEAPTPWPADQNLQRIQPPRIVKEGPL